MEKVLILTADSNTGYPVPATKGGAVSELVENIIDSNEKSHIFNFELVSIYDEKAKKKAEKYNFTKFYWYKPTGVIRYLDNLIFEIAKLLLKERSKSFKSMLTLIQYIFFARKLLKRNNYDKIIIENTMLLFWTVKGLKKYQGKYYYHAHNLPSTNAFLKKTLLNTTKVLTVSNFVKNRISAGKTKFPKIYNKKVTVFHNRIDLNHFKILNDFEVERLRQKFGLNKNDKVILFAGRISWEKGIDKLVDAVKKLDSNDIKILIVGSILHGENKARKNEYVKKLEEKIHNLDSKIVFTGYISYEIMPVVYNLADIAVLPSMWEEPAGLTPLEAMACGTPVITTDSGGIPKYVGKSAIILKRNTNLVADIAKNITNLLNDKKLYELYKLEGLSRVQLYNSNKYAEELKKIL